MEIEIEIETCHRNALDEKIVLLGSNSSFLLQELHNKQIIIQKLLDNIHFNNDKKKTVKYLSENKKQKVQHQDKQQEKLLETVRQTIKKTDPPKKSIEAMQTKQRTQKESYESWRFSGKRFK